MREQHPGSASVQRPHHLWLHWLGLVAVIVGLFAPMVQVPVVSTGPVSASMPASGSEQSVAWQQVAVVGDFQTALNCTPFDSTCEATQLTNHDGLWTGLLQVPAGTYQWQVVATKDNTPKQTDIQSVTINDGDAGLYVEYNALTGEATAVNSPALAMLQTDMGAMPMAPENGNYAAVINAPGTGPLNLTLQLNGQPLAPTQAQVQQGRNLVTMDPNGAVVNVDYRGYGTVTLQRTDANSQPVPGGCYEIRLSDGTTSKACDTDDQNPDGMISFPFPTQFAPGPAEITEVTTPDGATPAEMLQADITEGDNTLTMTAGEPAVETTDVVILRQDTSGTAVGGACVELQAADGTTISPVCDEDGDLPDDGRIGFSSVPVGDYTVHETRTPDGYEPAAPLPITVAAGQPNEFALQSAPTTSGFGDLTISRTDDAGNPLNGFCVNVTNDAGETVGESCDNGTGTVAITAVPAGMLTVTETQAPDSYEPAASQQVEVVSDQSASLTLSSAQSAPQLTTITISRIDENGAPQVGACFALIDAATGTRIAAACDGDDGAEDSSLQLRDVPLGSYTLQETTAPQTAQPAPDTSVDATTGEAVQVTVSSAVIQPTDVPTEAPTETPTTAPTEAPATETPIPSPTATPAPEAGDLIVTLLDGSDAPVPGACFELRAGERVIASSCDTEDAFPNNGNTGFFGVPAGDYTLHLQSLTPDVGTVADQAITVPANAEATQIVRLEAAATPTPEPTADTRGTNAIETAVPNPGGEGSTVTVDVTNSESTVCVQLDTTGGIGFLDAPAACDNDTNDADPTEGVIQLANIADGTYALSITQGPDALTAADPVTVSVSADQGTTIDLNPIISPIATPTPDPTATPEPTATPMPEPTATATATPATFSFNVTTVDEGGAPLAGACYALDGGDPVCDDDGDGVVTLTNLVPGDYTLSQTTTPQEYMPASDLPITVPTDNLGTATVQNARMTGTLTLSLVDAEGQDIPDVCVVALDGGDPVCDNGPADAQADAGRIILAAIPTGDHSLTVTSVPNGYDLPTAPQTVSIVADATAELTITLARTAPASGNLDVTVTLDGSGPVTGACVSVTSSTDDTVISICDGDILDANPADGVVGFTELPVGTYLVSIQDGTTIDGGDLARVTPVSVSILADETSTASIVVPAVPTTGVLRVVTQGDAPVAGAAYTLASADTSIDLADGATDDQDGTPGIIQRAEIPAGDYLLTMTTTPDGYQTATDVPVVITAGETTSVTVTLDRAPQFGTVIVTTRDANGDPVSGACYALMQNGASIQQQCDASDDAGQDGVTRFTDVPVGNYLLTIVTMPQGAYSEPAAQTITVAADAESVVTIDLAQANGRLTITTVDTTDTAQTLSNACYQLTGETTFGPFCDGDDTRVDGKVSFVNVPAGDYTLTQTTAPTGYTAMEDQIITIAAGQYLQITVKTGKIPAPTETGTLVILPVAPNGAEVAGGCYQLYQNGKAVSGRVCDNDDQNDKRITFADLAVGDYEVRELLAPSADYVIADPVTVTITKDEQTDVQIKHNLKTGSLLVKTVNSTGQPLANACFTLTGQDDTLCSDARGELLVSDLNVGTLTLTQTTAPTGYRVDTTPRELTIKPGQTTVITITYEVAPAPNTGTLNVQVFTCPTGEGQDRSVFVGGAQGNQLLKQTVGCEPQAATFTLAPEDGSGTTQALTATAEGKVQATIPQGIYVLTETKPDLPGVSNARVRIGVGQMTTVIVLNYVAPPKPAPATVTVEAYTCVPSFNGTTYSDFATNCLRPEGLTNQITFRADGETRLKAVTGDHGQLGKTALQNVPAGTWQLFAEKPYATPLMYVFCGSNPDNPADFKAINGGTQVTLASGEAITCRVFLIPEMFTATTGAIMVHTFNCPLDAAVRGYDYKNNCEVSTDQQPFRISLFNETETTFEPTMTVSANADGIVRFPNLHPGTYQLEEVKGVWCFAQSNAVDAQGNVVVKVNTLSEVWVYNCVGAQTPPNTGSGDAEDLLNQRSAPDNGLSLMLNFGWSAVVTAGWLTWRHLRHSA